MAEKSKEVVERRRPRETVRAFVLAIALALGIRTFVVEPFKIPATAFSYHWRASFSRPICQWAMARKSHVRGGVEPNS